MFNDRAPIRFSQSVRAPGFSGGAFGKTVGTNRYRWMKLLGNANIGTGKRGARIANPAGIEELLQLVIDADKAGVQCLLEKIEEIPVEPLNRELQLLGGTECDFLACLDLDRFSGRGIAPHASCAFPDLQDAKTRNADSLALLEMFGNEANQIAKESFTGPFRHLMLFGQGRRKMLKRDGTAALGRRGWFVSFRHDCPLRSMESCDSRI
jgi:hypothetical protein